MFKVLIVDDEPIIRKGLINIINWKQFNCTVCGEAWDGVDGIKKIQKLRPDIIFVDINMPEVDGLTMIKETKEVIPHSKIIILTGYRNFDYIQEAMKLGAFDYLLKPSKIEEISEILKRATLELRYKNKNAEELERLKQHFDKTIPILREKFLYDIIFKINKNKEEILQEMELYDININEYVMIIAEIDDDSENQMTQYQRQLYQFGVINAFEEMFTEEFTITKIGLSNKQTAFIIQHDQQGQYFINEIYKKANDLQEMIKNCFDFTITISISSKGNGIFGLSEKVNECLEGLEYKFYMGKNSIILFEDLHTLYKEQDYSILQEYHRALLKSLKAGNYENVQVILKEIFDQVTEIGILDKEVIKTFYWNLVQSINNIRVTLKSKEETRHSIGKDITSLYHMIQECEDLGALHHLLEEVVESIIGKVNRLNKNNINQILQKAIDYIHMNYHQSITLNDVAEYTYVSIYYLSRMFKKELEVNFVDFLNEYRISKAKIYLRDTQYKTYEIAEMVGIQDPHYFSKLFKKYAGITPTEYKTKGNDE